jgi:DNA-binding transcriptional LysR family regulator
MGRQIAAHLSQQNLTLAHRFELDSYHAIMAMVAQGAGWTILTPLGLMRAQRFRDEVDVMSLPFAPLSRQITLTARRDILGPIPAEIAHRMKPILQELVIDPIRARMPWVGESLRLL